MLLKKYLQSYFNFDDNKLVITAIIKIYYYQVYEYHKLDNNKFLS